LADVSFRQGQGVRQHGLDGVGLMQKKLRRPFVHGLICRVDPSAVLQLFDMGDWKRRRRDIRHLDIITGF
jgi:hypothetical protein